MAFVRRGTGKVSYMILSGGMCRTPCSNAMGI
jgi:hypothetical protein